MRLALVLSLVLALASSQEKGSRDGAHPYKNMRGQEDDPPQEGRGYQQGGQEPYQERSRSKEDSYSGKGYPDEETEPAGESRRRQNYKMAGSKARQENERDYDDSQQTRDPNQYDYQQQQQQQQQQGSPPAPTGAGAQNTVILSLALSWQDLWREDASLEEVPQDERDETINELLLEIGNKMKRRHKVQELIVFNPKKVSQNLALVEYPLLSDQTEIELNMIANQLLQLGGSVMNVNIFVNNQPIQIVDLGMGGQGANYHQEEHPHPMHEGIMEGPPGAHGGHHDHHHYQAPNQGMTLDQRIAQVHQAMDEFSHTMEHITSESQTMVDQYTKDMEALDTEYKQKKEEVDKVYYPRFQNMEEQYQTHQHNLQEAYDDAYYSYEEASEEYHHLMDEQAQYGHNDEL